MAVRNRNFSGETTPSIIDDTYINCNFSQPEPVNDSGDKKGIRLFPGDDTARTFIECNLVNCEPPPGSTITGCNTTIRENRIYSYSDFVEIDIVTMEIENFVDVIYGHYQQDGSYTYKDPFIEEPNLIIENDLNPSF
jgi:hypothetical protein